ncbi:MAG: hypothetical protein GY696_07525 [Gammaproteobacteria bacterium]|nr:hypothetical protein [Gammaproteobacteria bacterium]
MHNPRCKSGSNQVKKSEENTARGPSGAAVHSVQEDYCGPADYLTKMSEMQTASENLNQEGSRNIPVHSLAKLGPGTLNPLGAWNQFRGWLREWGYVLALLCILIFCGTKAGAQEQQCK